MTAEHRVLLKHLRGAQQIVINTCHGGFGLSVAAIKRYYEIKNQPVWIEPNRRNTRVSTVWLVPPERRVDILEGQAWNALTNEEQRAHNDQYSSQTWNCRELERDDPVLVQVVKELGSAANDRYSDLKIVQVPPDVDWVIEEYDGDEWVAEQHRTWR
jgi:hypothetical protein